MDKSRYNKHAKLHGDRFKQAVATDYDSQSTRIKISDNNTEDYRDNFSHRHGFNLQSVKYLLLALNIFSTPIYANEVGGVSATANPVANSSGSVSNLAVQNLSGPYITNTHGNGVSCQGATLSITPFATLQDSWKEPYEESYMDPVFDTSDINNDGLLDNPGSVLYYKPTRTGQKTNHSIGWGISMNITVPLDKRHNEGCLKAANTQNELNKQILANKRLDFEMARLKHCAEQKRLGVTFHPSSPASQICSDIVVANPHGVIPNHQHEIPK